MKIVLLGAPGSQKTDVAIGLHDKIGIPIAVDPIENLGYVAAGPLADYRTELRLASDRSINVTDNQIFVHSLLDSSVYLSRRIKDAELANDEDTFLRHFNSFSIVGMMIVDSFRYDLLFLVKGHGDGEYDQEIAETCELIIDALELDHIVLEGSLEQKINDAVSTVGEFSGQESDSIESSR